MSQVSQQNMADIFGSNKISITYNDFNLIKTIIDKPNFDTNNKHEAYLQITQYLMQKIKMLGCYALTAERFDLLSNSTTNQPKPKAKPLFSKTQKEEAKRAETTEKTYQISRLDSIVGLFNCVDGMVGQNLVNIMAKFPLALPLIIRNIYEQNKFKLLLPWLNQPIIKWETHIGKIVENHLFKDSFKMIVALRIGDAKHQMYGKSTLLNQLFKEKYIFSSCCEPGAENNRPLTLDGTAQMVFLIKETASDKLWETVLKQHYFDNENELLILANLHGDALDYPDHLEFFKTIASSYIVFVMPNIDDFPNKSSQLKSKLGLEQCPDRLTFVMIDPKNPELFDDNIVIETNKISNDSTILKLRNILKTSLNNDNVSNPVMSTNFNGIEMSEHFHNEETEEFIEYVKKNSCQFVKSNLVLQTIIGENALEVRSNHWNHNNNLKTIIQLIANILLLDTKSRLKAMDYIQHELERIVSQEVLTNKQEYQSAKLELLVVDVSDQLSGSKSREKLNKILDQMQKISLGLEHFFRECGRIYELTLVKNPKNKGFSKFANSYAELLIGGQAIEILDGDTSTMNGPWLTAILHNVNQKFPNLRIFVISILGLQSSGKSTLLNALFGCKFAVSVGRCTRGLFMRLLFIDNKYKSEMNMNFDAILLIDTEGLGAPEKQNDPQNERKDRVMTTFAMGISHLTIINVLGEYMNSLTEILQIAVVSMAKLEKVETSPEIILVQHLTEANTEKLTMAKKQFSDALNKAIDFADKSELSIGIKNSESLRLLKQSISSGNIFNQMRPFKNGATPYAPPSEQYHEDVVNLYKQIIKTANQSLKSSDFISWSDWMQNCWSSVKDQDFMRFNDVKQVQLYLEISNKLYFVKETILHAFEEHSVDLTSYIKSVLDQIENNVIKKQDILNYFKDTIDKIPENKADCQHCFISIQAQTHLYAFVKGKTGEHNIQSTIQSFIHDMRHLYFNLISQKLNAEQFKRIESKENLLKIKIKIKEELSLNKNPNELTIDKITASIWCDLESDAKAKILHTPPLDQIDDEINLLYSERTNFADDCNTDRIVNLDDTPAIGPEIVHGKAFGEATNLKPYLVMQLDDKIKKLGELIVNNERAEVYKKGMIAKMRTNLELILNETEKQENIKLLPDFKWKATIYSIQRFKNHMFKLQKTWNEMNNPLIILEVNKDEYIQWIRNKLSHGFGFYSDGYEAGSKMLLAVRQQAINSIITKKHIALKSQEWISNTEKIRLEYFAELVNEVRIGNNERALKYFDFPQRSVTEWYKNKLLVYSSEEMNKLFRTEFETIYNQLCNKLHNSTIVEKRGLLEKYLKDYSGLELSFKLNLEDYSDSKDSDNFDVGIRDGVGHGFRTAMKTLNTSEVTDLSEDQFYLNRLGCTHSCPICSAMCWMPAGHDSDIGDSKLHHTCHQSMGFTGVHHSSSNALFPDPCHDQKHASKGIWFFKNKDFDFKQVLESKGYDNEWKFKAHPKNHFNKLMLWFFYKLQNEIAIRKGHKPAKESEMKDYKMHKLNIDKIMASVYSSIYSH